MLRLHFSPSEDFRSFASLLDFPMGESVEVSAPRAGPAPGFRIRALGMGHFIYDPALHASSRFAAHEFHFRYGLHKILSIRKAPQPSPKAIPGGPDTSPAGSSPGLQTLKDPADSGDTGLS